MQSVQNLTASSSSKHYMVMVGQPSITNCADYNSWKTNEQVTMIYLACLHFPMVAPESTRERVPLTWHAPLCTFMWLGGTLKKSFNTWVTPLHSYKASLVDFGTKSTLVLHVTQLNVASEFVLWYFVLLCSKSNITMSQSKLTGYCTYFSIWIIL